MTEIPKKKFPARADTNKRRKEKNSFSLNASAGSRDGWNSAPTQQFNALIDWVADNECFFTADNQKGPRKRCIQPTNQYAF